MGFIDKWDHTGMNSASDEARQNSEAYWKGLDKQKKAAQLKKEREFAEQWREEQRKGFMEDIYGIQSAKEDTDGYQAKIVISGKQSRTVANNQASQVTNTSLGKGFGNRGNKGGYQDTRTSLRGPSGPIVKGSLDGLKRR